MCGIAGLMMRHGQAPDPAILDRFQTALWHRGPDGSGRSVRDGVALLSTRLAILDLDTGAQPLYGPGIVLVANAEIYNDPALRAEYRDAVFHTGSDCESAVHVYAARGLSFAEHLRGMYAIAVHDTARQRLVLARDPFGIKPLYYTETDELFAFASEPQALINAGLVAAEVAAWKRAELLQMKFTTGTETIFRGIRRVAPGETLCVEQGVIVERRQQAALPPPDLRTASRGSMLDQLDRVLTDAVSVHLRADVPYGLFLSGGIDSTALLALMQRETDRPVQALTVGYAGAPDADESGEAMRLARAIGAECHRVEVGPDDLWALSPRVAAAIDDPTTDAAALPTFMLAQEAAARGLKVTLCGEGADELFGGYARYRRARAPWGRLARKPRSRGSFDGHQSMRTALSGWHDGLDTAEARERMPGRTRVQVLQAIDCAEWLPNDLLTKLDRCLMVHGIEGRTPFIDPVVADFAFRLPDRLKVGPRLGKTLLRDWLARALPVARPYAKKKGFTPPIGPWMAARHEELARLVSAQPGIAALMSLEQVGQVFRGAGRALQPAWSLLFYALWHSHHVLGLASDGDVGEVLSEAARPGRTPVERCLVHP